ncbi:MAG: type II toxin-antitoxin system RatA family toxin [Pseudomonadota bacterium]
MPKLSNSRIISFSIEKIYQAVMDIDSYPRILNFIRSIKILEKSDSIIKARVFVGLPMLTFSYDCRITYKEPEYINIELISGPLKKLQASWKFTPISENQCQVNYSLDSEFKNPLMEMTAGAIFASQLNHSIKAFEDLLKRS